MPGPPGLVVKAATAVAVAAVWQETTVRGLGQVVHPANSVVLVVTVVSAAQAGRLAGMAVREVLAGPGEAAVPAETAKTVRTPRKSGRPVAVAVTVAMAGSAA